MAPARPPPEDVGIAIPLLMSAMAGAATSLGASVVFCMKALPSPSQLAFTLGLAAGVMITVSVFELFLPVWWEYGATAMLSSALGGAACFLALTAAMERMPCCSVMPEMQDAGAAVTAAAAAATTAAAAAAAAASTAADAAAAAPAPAPERAGSTVGRAGRAGRAEDRVPLVEIIVPSPRSRSLVRQGSLSANFSAEDLPLQHAASSSSSAARAERQRQWRVGTVMMVALTAHNFPEGLAVAASAMTNVRLGLVMTVAIAIHNIPEGLTIATPIFAATGDRWRAFWMATASGLSEPLGALTALVFLRPHVAAHPGVLARVTCGVGGVMVAVALKELIPEAMAYQRPKAMWNGVLAGGCVMALTMLVEV